MKKILVLMLALSLVLCFAACKDSEETPNDPATDTTNTSGDQSSDVSDMGNISDMGDAENLDDKEYYEEIEVSTLDIADIFLCSEVSENTWENTFVGLGYTLDEGWSFKTDNELMVLNGLNDAADLEEFIEAATTCTTVYDLYASDADGLNSVNLSTRKMNAENYDNFDAANYFQDGTIQRTLENAGYTNLTSEYKLIDINGRELDSLTVSGEYKGNVIYQTYIVFKNDGYIVEIGVTSSPENTNEQILDNFYWSNK